MTSWAEEMALGRLKVEKAEEPVDRQAAMAESVVRTHRPGHVLNHVDGKDIEACEGCGDSALNSVTWPCTPYRLAAEVLGEERVREILEPRRAPRRVSFVDALADRDKPLCLVFTRDACDRDRVAGEAPCEARHLTWATVALPDEVVLETLGGWDLLSQGRLWWDAKNQLHAIAFMDPRHAGNCWRMLLRKAPSLEFRDAFRTMGWAPQGEMARDAFDCWLAERMERPEEWLADQPLFRALWLRSLHWEQIRLADSPLWSYDDQGRWHALLPDRERRTWCGERLSKPSTRGTTRRGAPVPDPCKKCVGEQVKHLARGQSVGWRQNG